MSLCAACLDCLCVCCVLRVLHVCVLCMSCCGPEQGCRLGLAWPLSATPAPFATTLAYLGLVYLYLSVTHSLLRPTTTTPAGKYVDLKDTIADFKGVLEGKYDDLPEMAFYMVRG